MNMLNSLILQGVMTAGLTPQGRFTVENTIVEGGGEKKTVILCKLIPTLSESESVRKVFKNGSMFRLVGYLDKDTDGELMVMVEHFERLGFRSGKYTFTKD